MIYFINASIPAKSNRIKPIPKPPKAIGIDMKADNISKIPEATLSFIEIPIAASITDIPPIASGNSIKEYP